MTFIISLRVLPRSQDPMFWWEALPWEIRHMIFGYLEKKDIYRLAAAGPEFFKFFTKKQNFAPTEWLREVVWGEQPFKQAADARAATRILKIIKHTPVENADERFAFETELPFPPYSVGEEKRKHSGQASGTLLHLAAYSGLLNVVIFLLSKRADKDISLECNETALLEYRLGKVTPVYLAMFQKHYAIVDHLLRAGAEIGWATHWPIYRQLPEVLGAMISEAHYSKDGIWRAFEYTSSAWLEYTSSDGYPRRKKVEKNQLELVNVLIPHCVYEIIDIKDRMGFVNLALVALDCSAALALAQAGFASHGGDTQEDFDVKAFARACVSEEVCEESFEILCKMFDKVLGARDTGDIDWAILNRVLEARAKSEEQKRRACIIRKMVEEDRV
ncbi:ankyrin unc44 [Colletotrichum camelliae]|nr:ankyrin unc44 [Colletotrichum camelliae]